jgi:hypothetical protein
MTIMSIQSIIWALQSTNVEFESVFAANWHVSVKSKDTTFGF